jgi:predicted DNA-binding transcriptional regulator YafY
MVLFKKEHAKHPHAKHLNSYIRSNRWGKDKDITITYKKENGDLSERKIRPLYAKKDVLVAHDHGKNAYRSFKLERIQSMTKTAFEQGFERRLHDNP